MYLCDRVAAVLLGMTQKARAVLHPFYDSVRAQATLPPKAFLSLVPVVLAAGASTRMGRPKEFLEFQGLTCLEVVLGACAGAGLGVPIVVTCGERRAAVESLLAGSFAGSRVVVNPTPGLGQTSSLRVGIAALPVGCRGFVIYPVDHPLVTAADVVRLAEAFTQARPPVAIVAPSFQHRRGHPVIVDASLVPALLALPPGASPRPILAPTAAPTHFVDFPDDRILQDMDTPQAYESAQLRYAKRPTPPE
jgi:molybdenum cofactor cytidylyltransferase